MVSKCWFCDLRGSWISVGLSVAARDHCVVSRALVGLVSKWRLTFVKLLR